MLYFKVGEKIKFPYFFIPLFILFYFGGLLQYLGLISPTQTNIILILMLTPLLFKKSALNFFLKEYILFLLLIYSVIVGFYLSVSIVNIFVYIYYIFCVVFFSVFSRYLCNYFYKQSGVDCLVEKSFKFIKVFIITQFVFCLLESIFIDKVLAFAPFNMLLEDAVFGTMYLKSDSSLAAIIQILIIAFFIFNRNFKEKLFYSILGVGIIFFGGSKAAQAIIGFILAVLWFNFIYMELKMRKYGFNYLILMLSFACVCCFIYFFGIDLGKQFYEYTIDAYNSRFSWYSADRLAVFGQFFSEDIKIIGDGQLTYYNPMTQEWLYDSGFSSYYSLYIDLGVIGLIFYFIYYILRIYLAAKNFFIFLLFLLILMVYSAFSFALSDLAFVFVLNYTLFLYSIYCKDKKVY